MERVAGLSQEAQKAASALEAMRRQAAEHRAKGLRLDEEGGNPDESLEKADRAHAGAMAALRAGDPRIIRLFPDAKAEEQRYFRATGIFPIMHTVVIREALLEAHPWLAMNVVQAFRRSNERMGQFDDKIVYIAKLFNEEVHLVARPNITSVEQLRGLKVNLDAKGSGVALESMVLECEGWQRDTAVTEPVEPKIG